MKRMRKYMMLGLGVIAISGLAGCAVTVSPPVAITTDFKDIDFSKPLKVGEDCMTPGFFGPTGNASIYNAAKSAGITKVKFVDYKRVYFLFGHPSECVVVYGE